MEPKQKKPKLGCEFYMTEGGDEPVRSWLKAQSIEVKTKIGEDIEHFQWRWPVEKPRVGTLGKGLWEVRSSVFDVDYRVIFFIRRASMVLLHAFRKTSQKTPKPDMNLASSRKKEVEQADRKRRDT